MISVGDMVAHELYVHSRGILVEETEEEYIIYYMDAFGKEKFQQTKKEKIIKIKSLPPSLVNDILSRYQFKTEQEELTKKIVEVKEKILKGIGEIIKGG